MLTSVARIAICADRSVDNDSTLASTVCSDLMIAAITMARSEGSESVSGEPEASAEACSFMARGHCRLDILRLKGQKLLIGKLGSIPNEMFQN